MDSHQYLKLRSYKQVSSNPTLDSQQRLTILRQYALNTSKDFLEQLFSEDPDAMEKLGVLKQENDLLQAVFLDELYHEQLEAAGYTLILLTLLDSCPSAWIGRYKEICRSCLGDLPTDVKEIIEII